MSSVVKKKKTRGPDLSELRKLFGPAPVLSSESPKAYNTILSRLMEALKPDDFVLEMLVFDLADATWEMKRYKCHKVLVGERTRIERERKAARYKTQEQLDEMLAEPADEFEEFQSVQSGIRHYEQLDRLQTVATARRDDALAQIEQYRQGLAQRAQQASDEIIEAEFEETSVEAPAIAGPDDTAE